MATVQQPNAFPDLVREYASLIERVIDDYYLPGAAAVWPCRHEIFNSAGSAAVVAYMEVARG